MKSKLLGLLGLGAVVVTLAAGTLGAGGPAKSAPPEGSRRSWFT